MSRVLSHMVSFMSKEVAIMQQNKEEKREQIKARRREAYLKKDDECAVNLQSNVQNAAWHPLGDITNAYQPSSMELDEKKELLKARRRAAYRKKKDELLKATGKQQDGNQAARAISGKKCFMFQQYDDSIYILLKIM